MECVVAMTDTEHHRHRCLVRQCIAWRNDLNMGSGWVREWLKGYRGDVEALRRDLNEQIERGNTGAIGEWIETTRGEA
jgi:hypothetical protein